ncbi:MAG: ABC transporter ATP-binding protein [Deltaproteobacteria bacterium]|nr:ABC transporter ATP-binding protein [Deltaproteobacteria bacterium]
MSATVELRGLSRRFGSFGLDRVHLRLAAGEYWVLLGPSGCGKSLLLQTITGLHAPDGGRVHLSGRDVTDLPPEARDVGLVFQQSALFPHYSVAGNIEYGLRARRVPQAERKRRVEEVVAALRLQPILSRPVATLSGGEAQRVAIARAVAIKPAVLLLDEPLSLLDHNARLELQSELKRIHAELGLTTLHVTHSRDEARAMGDHCAVMLAGAIVQKGRTADVFGQPRCPFVARFLGVEGAVAASAPPACQRACLDAGARCTSPAGEE